MTIGERIKKARLKKGLSQTELAEQLGYKSRSSVNKIEVGGRDIPRSQIVKIADILGVTPSYLMGWENEPGNKIIDRAIDMHPLSLSEDLDMRRIERARNKMNAEEKDLMMSLLKFNFKDYFSEDFEDDDVDE